jgi:hypothetical protein
MNMMLGMLEYMTNTNKHWILFLDDLREPLDVTKDKDELLKIEVARTSREAIEMVKSFGLPAGMYLDHDLGGDDTAMYFVNWLIDYDMKHDIIGSFWFHVHSANPVGRLNIVSLLNNYLNYKDSL